MSAFTDPDGFMAGLRAMPRRGLATPRVCDFTVKASLLWPEGEWYPAETFEEYAAQRAVRKRREVNLPDRVPASSPVYQLAASMLRNRSM